MERNHFKERTVIRMAALGITQAELAERLGVAQARVTEAMRGDKVPAAGALRVKIELKLAEMIDERRRAMIAEVEPMVRAMGYPGRVSVVLPEDVRYLVTECGLPVGWYNPVTGKMSLIDQESMS